MRFVSSEWCGMWPFPSGRDSCCGKQVQAKARGTCLHAHSRLSPSVEETGVTGPAFIA